MKEQKGQTVTEVVQALVDALRWEDDGGVVFPDDEKAELVRLADDTCEEGCKHPQPEPQKP